METRGFDVIIQVAEELEVTVGSKRTPIACLVKARACCLAMDQV